MNYRSMYCHEQCQYDAMHADHERVVADLSATVAGLRAQHKLEKEAADNWRACWNAACHDIVKLTAGRDALQKRCGELEKALEDFSSHDLLHIVGDTPSKTLALRQGYSLARKVIREILARAALRPAEGEK